MSKDYVQAIIVFSVTLHSENVRSCVCLPRLNALCSTRILITSLQFFKSDYYNVSAYGDDYNSHTKHMFRCHNWITDTRDLWSKNRLDLLHNKLSFQSTRCVTLGSLHYDINIIIQVTFMLYEIHSPSR